MSFPACHIGSPQCTWYVWCFKNQQIHLYIYIYQCKYIYHIYIYTAPETNMEPKSWRFGRWISLFIFGVKISGCRGWVLAGEDSLNPSFSSPILDQPWNLACSNLNSLLPPVITFLMSRSTWILKVDWIWFFHCNHHVFVAKCLHFAFEPPPKKVQMPWSQAIQAILPFLVTQKTIDDPTRSTPFRPHLDLRGLLVSFKVSMAWSADSWTFFHDCWRFRNFPANHRLDVPKTL